MAERILRLDIRGQVQGVGYRWSMVEQAQRLGVRGWVKNRRDGSVEAVVTGTAEALERIVAWAQRGPPSAAVSSVDISPGTGAFETFEQRPTE